MAGLLQAMGPPLNGALRTSLIEMPWWAPLGGIVGAVAVFTGLLLVEEMGAGPFAAMTVSANLVASVAIDHFGWLHVPEHELRVARRGSTTCNNPIARQDGL